MSETKTKTHMSVRAEVLDELCETAKADPAEGLVKLWLALGVDLADPNLESFEPWTVAIPESQWQRFCAALVEWDRANGSMCGAALLMVNKGPSAFPEEVK